MLRNPTTNAAIAPDGVNDLRFQPRIAIRAAIPEALIIDGWSNGFIVFLFAVLVVLFQFSNATLVSSLVDRTYQGLII